MENNLNRTVGIYTLGCKVNQYESEAIAEYLEANGYSCDALELIDPEETPKNVMLRAVAKKNFSARSPAAKKAASEYEQARRFLLGE